MSLSLYCSTHFQAYIRSTSPSTIERYSIDILGIDKYAHASHWYFACTPRHQKLNSKTFRYLALNTNCDEFRAKSTESIDFSASVASLIHQHDIVNFWLIVGNNSNSESEINCLPMIEKPEISTHDLRKYFRNVTLNFCHLLNDRLNVLIYFWIIIMACFITKEHQMAKWLKSWRIFVGCATNRERLNISINGLSWM